MNLPKLCSPKEAAELVARLGGEFAVVRNPGYVHPPYELYPLAPPTPTPLPELAAVVCDMDGTTTTTEPLCVHSLETMIRLMTGRPERAQWAGLGEADHPHVIGNSTTKHVEYLIQTYGGGLERRAYLESLTEAVLWTLARGRDQARREEAANSARRLGLAPLLADRRARALLAEPQADEARLAASARELAGEALAGFEPGGRDDLVRGGIEIYYTRYHRILEALGAGQGPTLAERLLGPGRRMIEPMPGVALFLATLKGLLDPAEAAALGDALAAPLLAAKGRPAPPAGAREALAAMAARGQARPVPVAIVTSSLRFEAEIVLAELFRILREEVAEWPLATSAIERLLAAFADPLHFYDAVVTANDSSEIRLKPHRDLYSLALHRLGIPPERFDRVLGLEDSESGVTGIRAAGIGLAVAVPFDQTLGHDLRAATRICPGGLPEVMFEQRFFLD